MSLFHTAISFYIGSKRRRKVPFDKELRETTRRYVVEARSLLDSREIPKPVHDNRCNGCSVRSICLPDEVAYLSELDERPNVSNPHSALRTCFTLMNPDVQSKRRVNDSWLSKKTRSYAICRSFISDRSLSPVTLT